MVPRQSVRKISFSTYRCRFLTFGRLCLLLLILITLFSSFIILLSSHLLFEAPYVLDEIDDDIQSHQETVSQKSVNEEPHYQAKTTIDKENFSIRSPQPFERTDASRFSLNQTNLTKEALLAEKNRTEQRLLYYSFIDINALDVNLAYLDEERNYSGSVKIHLPNPDSHPYSRIINVKGDSSIIIYNRIPESYEFTMGSLLGNMSNIHSFKYIPSQIYTPFSYNYSSLLAIARSLDFEKHQGLIYERHIHFFDYYTLNIPIHPVWINLVPDPIYRVAAEFKHSRDTCLQAGRCFVRSDAINETLDECVQRRPPQECVSPIHGVSRMLPFFCGSVYPSRCQEESSWAMKTAKQNIDFFYTVIGITEQFYKFLYVLEKLFPHYFKLARLVFMNQHHPDQLADIRDINVIRPSEKTIGILRPFLEYEYELYEYIKKRFIEQYEMLVELDR